MMKTFRIVMIAACVAGLISGCAGKRSAKAEKGAVAEATAVQDMTRPPTTIGAERDIVVESNPDETISFEEWKRRQAEEAAKGSDSPEENPKPE